MRGDAPVGLICPPDHVVFATVAERLRARGHAVEFLEPGEPIPPATIDGLGALVNKKVRPESFDALYYADRTGVPTWNGFLPTTALSCRLVALYALEAVGCAVPAVYDDPPDGEYVAKTRYAWEGEPELGGEGEFYQELLESDAVDEKYYVVFDGSRWHARVLCARSKLFGEKEILGAVPPDPTLVDRMTDLAERIGARTLGVDFVRCDDGPYAVDVNPVPSYRETGLEDVLVDSIVSVL